MENTRKKALIAMSGGVDSSVAAYLMQQEGYDCLGVTMKLIADEPAEETGAHTCCSVDDAEDARYVAFRLGMPHYVMNFTREFDEAVISRFVEYYEKGWTPNPCIFCNRYLKFEKLYHRALELGCDCIATGHYARVEFDEGSKRWQLKKARNVKKDQSYVLCFMTQEQLAHTRFPLGVFADKEEIRQIAEEHHFINAHKHDSQDICFVPDSDYASFIRRRTGKEYPSGDFVDEEGRVLGRHKGIIGYTIGQRKGLGLALPAPLYVKKKNMEKNQVVLAGDQDLYESRLTAGDVNWISMEEPEAGTVLRVTAKPRYRAPEAEATVTVLDDHSISVVFDKPQRALTPGQIIVLYQGEIVVAGGIINIL